MDALPPVVAYDSEQLRRFVQTAVDHHGPCASLNHIDVSRVVDLSYLFQDMDFTGDISKWHTGCVENMTALFCGSSWNGDISHWNVGRVTNMERMFFRSNFTGDIADWDVANVVSMERMFAHCLFQGNLSRWQVGNVSNMRAMFHSAFFEGDISQWDVRRVTNMERMFGCTNYVGDLSKWRPLAIKDMSDMLTSHSLHNMGHPCFYHWYAAMAEFRVQDTVLLDFLHVHKPILYGMGCTMVQTCLALQDLWDARNHEHAFALPLPAWIDAT